MMPKVSIIIPTYNMARFVTVAVESALNEGYLDTEVIVVDDGSSDDTAELIRAYGDRVTYAFQENQGLPGTLNTLVALARGEYVRFLDADDTILPGTISSQVEILDADPALALVHAQAYLADEDGPIKGIRTPRLGGRSVQKMDRDSAFRWLIRGCKICKSTVMARKSAIMDSGEFAAESLPGEDWDMWLRISRSYGIAYVPQPVAFYRVHPLSITAGYTLESFSRSHRFTLDTLFANEPEIPEGLRSAAYAYLERNRALLAGQLRQRRTFVRHLGRAVWSHPAMLLEADTWSTAVEGLKTLLPRPLLRASRGVKRAIGERIASPAPESTSSPVAAGAARSGAFDEVGSGRHDA